MLLFDKTGTLTAGVPEIADIEALRRALDGNEVLRLAASLDQVSPHVLATAIVRAARERNLALEFPDDPRSSTAPGIEGRVGAHHVASGKGSFVAEGAPLPQRAKDIRRRTSLDGSSCVFVAVDGRVVGAARDRRPDPPRLAARDPVAAPSRDRPRDHGHRRPSRRRRVVGAALGVDRILSERTPAEKVEAVGAEREHGVTIMVGDGLNDAPALAAADIGVAMGARGATASSEAADMVLVVDRLDRLVDAITIAQRSRTIAVQSVIGGMGVAFGFMLLGAFGLFVPVVGALIQEAIDVASILNALRALSGGRGVEAVGRTQRRRRALPRRAP